MSVLMQNSFLDGILGAVSSPGSSGTGSGTLNFLTGLNASTATGSGASGVTGLLSLLGPVGSGVGMVANLIPGLDGFLENGFDFTCIGGQAYDKGNLDNDLNEIKQIANSANPADLLSVENVINQMSWRYSLSLHIIKGYRSGCSKSLRQKFADACKSIMTELENKFSFTTKSEQATGENNYTWVRYSIKGAGASSASATASVMPTITEAQFYSEYVPQIEAYALQNGLDQNEAIKTAYDKLFPGSGGWGGSGGVTVNEDGSIDWNVEAGNNRNNTMTYVLLAGAALLAWKVLKK